MATSLEILAPYLPYGIELQNPQGHRSKLIRLDINDGAEGILVEAGYVGSPSLCLPILRPFSALCEPLPDGTVPAVEVAKMALGGEADEIDWAEVEVRPTNAESTQAIDIVDTSDGLYHWVLVSISNTFDTDCDGNFTVNHAAVTDYLRSQHFALPVNGRPLLEGVDFIPKTSSAAPIDKNTALTPNQ